MYVYKPNCTLTIYEFVNRIRKMDMNGIIEDILDILFQDNLYMDIL